MTPKEKKLALWSKGVLIKDIAQRFNVHPSLVSKVILGERQNDEIERFIDDILKTSKSPTR